VDAGHSEGAAIELDGLVQIGYRHAHVIDPEQSDSGHW
jgi:hypothetical protein